MENIIAFIIAYLDIKSELANIISKEPQVNFNVRKCYDISINNWCQDIEWRKRISSFRFANIDALRFYLAENKTDFDYNLLNLFAEELNNNQVCVDYISNNFIGSTIQVDTQDDLFKSILDSKNYFRTEVLPMSAINRGRVKHISVDGYICRYCSLEQEDPISLYFREDNNRFTLTDYVTDVVASNSKKFILYSGAQTGKTTELKNLCWELQQSGAYLPISFEVRTSFDLKADQLPRSQYIDNKEVVIIIDALDEVNGPEREQLILAIKSYAHDNPDIKMVLSCRSNYRRDDTFDDFRQLFLQDMSDLDVLQYVKKCLGKTDFISLINSSGLSEFLKHPFFLNILIETYRNNKELPSSRSEIYKIFIDNSFNTEHSKEHTGFKIHNSLSLDESLELLKRVALSMSLMSKQSLNDNDMLKCLYNSPKYVELCKRFGILKYENNSYHFSHNAIREWLVASYLFEQRLEKARILSSYPNGSIKPDWYNIIILWISMYKKEDSDKVRPIIKWLEKTCLELIVHSDSDTIEQDARENIFKGVVLQYKSLGIRIGSILSNEYQQLVKFCQTPNVINFIIQELDCTLINTVYYNDLMGICSQINWTALKHQDKRAFNRLINSIDKKLIEKSNYEPNGDITYYVLENEYFANLFYLDKYFSLFSKSNNYEVINCLMTLITKTGTGDKYIDYILDKEQYIHDQHSHNCTTCVSRFEVYNSLSTVESYEGIKKILSHKFPDYFSYHSFDWDIYCRMMDKCLSAVSKYLNDGYTDLMPLVKNKYLEHFNPDENFYSRDTEISSLKLSFRRLYSETGMDKREKVIFKDRILNLLRNHSSYKQIQDEIVLATAWMTKDDLDEIYKNIDKSNDYELAFANWLSGCPDEEIKKIAIERNALIIPEPAGIKELRLRREQNLSDFANYTVFKKLVLEFIGIYSTKVKLYRRNYNDDDINEYVIRFCNHFIDNNDLYNGDDITSAVNDELYYNSFFMKIIYELFLTRDKKDMSPEYLERCFLTAKEKIHRLASGSCHVLYGVEAIKMLISGHIKISNDELIKLISFSSVYISKYDAGNFGHTYTLFEFITENVEAKELTNSLIEYVTQNLHNKNIDIHEYANYIVRNRITKGYDILLDYIESNEVYAASIANIFIENGECVDLIKSISQSLDIDSRLSIYSELIKNTDDKKWVLEQLEPIFAEFKGYNLTRALTILIASGSIEALSYLVIHIDTIDYHHSFHYNYDNTSAVSMLVTILEHRYSRDAFDYLYCNSIFNSLERIAIQNHDALIEVTSILNVLINKDERFKFINRYIISFEQKYYESNVGIGNIDRVIELIDHIINPDIEVIRNTTRQPVNVYVSYNWEVQSDCIVDHLCYVLGNNQIAYCRDKINCNYRDNIKEFMKAIHDGHYIVVVLSKPYLKSQNCLYELTGIMRHEDYKNRILPIVVDETIRDRHFYVELCKYWDSRHKDISSEISELEFNEALAEPLKEELRIVDHILDFLPKIKEYIDWTNAQSVNSLTSTNFKILIDLLKSSYNCQ